MYSAIGFRRSRYIQGETEKINFFNACVFVIYLRLLDFLKSTICRDYVHFLQIYQLIGKQESLPEPITYLWYC